MISPLVFMMGEHEAHFPVDVRYGKNHMWARPDCASSDTQADSTVWQVGLSAYAVRLLQDVYFLDLEIEAGMQLSPRQEIGSIESKKAESSLYTPLSGTVTAVNEQLLENPAAINVDKYGLGWLYSIQGLGSELLSAPAYMEHLQSAWQIAQRTIKGQANA